MCAVKLLWSLPYHTSLFRQLTPRPSFAVKKALQQAGLFPSEPDPTVVLANASQFARDHGYSPGVSAVPTCGINGEEIPSEVAKPNST